MFGLCENIVLLRAAQHFKKQGIAIKRHLKSAYTISLVIKRWLIRKIAIDQQNNFWRFRWWRIYTSVIWPRDLEATIFPLDHGQIDKSHAEKHILVLLRFHIYWRMTNRFMGKKMKIHMLILSVWSKLAE